MASMPGYHNTVTCPYNSSHVIMKERFQTHLIKCAKNYPEIKLRKCPFNTTHLIVPDELDEHVRNCEDRASLDLYKFSIPNTVSRQEEAKEEVEPVFVPATDVNGENWDDDDYPTYDPQEYVKNNPIIRTLNLAPPSERKAFKEAERLRLNNMPKKN